MSTSTPPAWHFLEEKYVPVTTDPGYYPADVDEMCHNYTEAGLSIHSHKLPVSDAFREWNDREVLSKDWCAPPDPATFRERNDSPDPTGEDVWPLDRDQCPDCRCAPNMPHSPDCDGVRSGRETPTKLPVGAQNEHPACDVSQTGHAPDTGNIADTFSVPFAVQEFMFEELADAQLEYLHDILNKQSARILEMARDRFRKGYAVYGSAAYQWGAETRLANVLEELADAVVYQTTGSIE